MAVLYPPPRLPPVVQVREREWEREREREWERKREIFFHLSFPFSEMQDVDTAPGRGQSVWSGLLTDGFCSMIFSLDHYDSNDSYWMHVDWTYGSLMCWSTRWNLSGTFSSDHVQFIVLSIQYLTDGCDWLLRGKVWLTCLMNVLIIAIVTWMFSYKRWNILVRTFLRRTFYSV